MTIRENKQVRQQDADPIELFYLDLGYFSASGSVYKLFRFEVDNTKKY